MRWLQLREASIQTEAALLKCTHFLKAQSHIVHGALYQESIAGVSLKHEPVKEVLGLLEQAQGPVVLVLGDEVDGWIVELMQDQRHLVYKSKNMNLENEYVFWIIRIISGTYLHQDPTLLNTAFESCPRSRFDLWIVCYSSDFAIDSLSCSSYWNGFETIGQPFVHQTITPRRGPCSLFIRAFEPNGLKIMDQESQKRLRQRELQWPVSSALAHWLDLA